MRAQAIPVKLQSLAEFCILKSHMDVKELAERVMPSEVFAMVTYDPETHEVGIQYGYVLLSLPREDVEPLIELLEEALERLEANREPRSEGRET